MCICSRYRDRDEAANCKSADTLKQSILMKKSKYLGDDAVHGDQQSWKSSKMDDAYSSIVSQDVEKKDGESYDLNRMLV